MGCPLPTPPRNKEGSSLAMQRSQLPAFQPCCHGAGGKRLLLYFSSTDGVTNSGFCIRTQDRHLDAFCDAVLAQVPSCNRQRGSVSPLPPVFPRMFLPSPCPSACLARSLSLPTSAQFPLLQPRGISHAGSQQVTPMPRARSHPPGAVGPLSSP